MECYYKPILNEVPNVRDIKSDPKSGRITFNNDSDTVNNSKMNIIKNNIEDKYGKFGVQITKHLDSFDSYLQVEYTPSWEKFVNLKHAMDNGFPKEQAQEMLSYIRQQEMNKVSPEDLKPFLSDNFSTLQEMEYPQGTRELFSPAFKEDIIPAVEREIDSKMKAFLKSINVRVEVLEGLRESLKGEGLQSNYIAIADILHKTILLDENVEISEQLAKSTAIFAIEFLGASNHPEASPLVKKALENIHTWEGFKSIEDYDSHKNNKHNLAILISQKLLERANESDKKFKKPNKTITFIEELVNRILQLFDKIWKGKYYKALDNFLKQKGIETKGVNQINLKPFEATINEIVDIIFFNKVEKIINSKRKKNSNNIKLNFQEVLNNNPKIKNIYYKLNLAGFMLTGSPSLSLVGSIFRESNESLNDLDWKVPVEMNDVWLERVKELFPNVRYKINERTREEQKFQNSDGAFTHTLLIEGFPVDFFVSQKEFKKDIKTKNTRWQDTFEAKLDIGRDKDIQDLINFKTDRIELLSNTKYAYLFLDFKKGETKLKMEDSIENFSESRNFESTLKTITEIKLNC